MAKDIESQLGNYIIRQNFSTCPEREGEFEYQGLGKFKCKKCGYIELNNYGKVKEYIDKHENVTLLELAHSTGLRFSEVRDIMKEIGAL